MIWVALLRGINVGGNNILPMAQLRKILSDLGHYEVRTYIQSGNCIFKSDQTNTDVMSEQLSDAIEKRFPFRPKVMIITAERLASAMANNPFPEAEQNPKSLYMSFMTEAPGPLDHESFDAIRMEDEDYAYKDLVFYHYAPGGVWKSKIGARVERSLGVPMTARNLNTVRKLTGLIKG